MEDVKENITDLSKLKNELSVLSDEEKKKISDYTSKIDLSSRKSIMNFGSEAQGQLKETVDQVLSSTKAKELSEPGDMIAKLVVDLTGFTNAEKPKGLFGFLTKTAVSAETFKARYETIEANVQKVSAELEEQRHTLEKDMYLYDEIYNQNKQYYKELQMYILAGKIAIEQAKEKRCKLVKIAEVTNDQMDVDNVKDFDDALNRLEKRIIDLELTKQIVYQTGPQIRLLVNINQTMIEKIQSTLCNTIPLWKNQLVLQIGIRHNEKAVRTQRMVADANNMLMLSNARQLHETTIETAEQMERGIIDIETIKKTNDELIATLTEVTNIQRKGNSKRVEVESELDKLSTDFNQRLLRIAKEQNNNNSSMLDGYQSFSLLESYEEEKVQGRSV